MICRTNLGDTGLMNSEKQINSVKILKPFRSLYPEGQNYT